MTVEVSDTGLSKLKDFFFPCLFLYF